MPNNIMNVLTIEGTKEQIKEIKDYVSSSESNFDFRQIAPQPDNIYLGDLGESKRVELYEEGIPNWYDWNRQNWGTKWNAYGICVDGNVVKFQTAWSPAIQIVSRLSTHFPRVRFRLMFASEDFGFTVGDRYYSDGHETFEIVEGGSSAAFEIACSVFPERSDDYQFIDGEIVCIEEDN